MTGDALRALEELTAVLRVECPWDREQTARTIVPHTVEEAYEVAEAALGWGAETRAVVDSGLPGPKGNREFFLHLRQRESPELPNELDRWIADVVGG